MTDKTATAPSLNGRYPRERIAVKLLFLANGLYAGAWSLKVPELAGRLDLTPFYISLMVVCYGVGSLTIMPIAGSQIARHGSTVVAKVAASIFLFTMLLISLAPNIWMAGVAVFMLGGFSGAMDVAMNANAVEVEKSMRKSIMSSCHAFWSLGGLIGSSVSGIMIDTFGQLAHAVIITIANAGVLLVATSMLMPDGPHVSSQHAAAVARTSIFNSPLPWVIGIIALFCMIQEGVIIDWSALYIKDELMGSLTVAALGAGAMHGTMTVMRLFGDGIRDRFGAVRTMQVSGVIAFSGLMTAGLASHAYVAIAGFALCGIGVSNMVPIAFSAAGNLPGMAKGVGISVVTVMGYSGTLFFPTLFGFVAEHTGFSAIFIGTPMLLIVVLLLSNLMRHADGIRGH